MPAYDVRCTLGLEFRRGLVRAAAEGRRRRGGDAAEMRDADDRPEGPEGDEDQGGDPDAMFVAVLGMRKVARDGGELQEKLDGLDEDSRMQAKRLIDSHISGGAFSHAEEEDEDLFA